MKYLENEQLSQLTALLTDCPVYAGGPQQQRQYSSCSTRVLHGRVEAFSMKRAGSDKKYATQLGSVWTAWQEQIESDAALLAVRNMKENNKNNTGRKRSASTGEHEVTKRRNKQSKLQSADSNSSKSGGAMQRKRANSLDIMDVVKKRKQQQSNNNPLFQLSTTLGDLSESSTRRLLTDLILTLNMSFPDYDFGSAKPTDFCRFPWYKIAMQRINEKLSEVASSREPGFLNHMWNAIDNVIDISNCEVLSYQPAARSSTSSSRSGMYNNSTTTTTTSSSEDDPLAFLEQTFLSSSSSSSATAATATTTQQQTKTSFKHKKRTSTSTSSNSTPPATPIITADVAVHAVVSPEDDEENRGAGGGDDDDDDDPITKARVETVLWSFNYFFVNKTTKRILLFTCIETMQCFATPSSMDDEYYDDETTMTTTTTNQHNNHNALNTSIAQHQRNHRNHNRENEDVVFVGVRGGNGNPLLPRNMNDEDEQDDEDNDDDDDDEEEEMANSRNMLLDNGSDTESVAGSENFDMDPESMVSGGIPIQTA